VAYDYAIDGGRLPEQGSRKYVVRNGDRFDFVPVIAGDWIETANNHAVLYRGSVEHVLGETLTSLEPDLMLCVAAID